MPHAYARFAKYYDLVYRDIVDYDADCDRIETLFRRFGSRDTESILDLACGTGTHALILARRGYRVTGLDVSASQLREARAKLRGRRLPVRFVRGDMRQFALGQTFDAATCLFGGFGYLLTDRDVRSHLRSVRRHLAPSGVYAFEFWQRSAIVPGHKGWYHRKKPFRLIRLDQSTLDPRGDRLRVSFQFFVFEGNRVRDRFSEAHVLRVYRIEEIRRLLASAGMRLVATYAGRAAGSRLPPVRRDTFAVLAVARPR